jgi:glycosyltransferase involved in cell wall biosynthesis
LDSVIGQTLQDIEIICVNDASLDDCGEILREYAKKDARIKVIEFDENKGAGAARNAGIDAARGKYIGFVDSDDWVDLNFYEKLSVNALNMNVEVVKGCIKEVDDKSNIEIESILFYDINNNIRKHKAYFYHSFTSAIYEKQFLSKNNIIFPHDYIIFEDPIFSIKVATYSNNIQIVDDICYYYTRNHYSSSFTKFTSLHAKDACKALKYTIKFFKSVKIPSRHYAIVIAYFINSLINIGIDIESCHDMADDIRNIISQTLVNIKADITPECWIEYFKLREDEKLNISRHESIKKEHYRRELENIRKITNIMRKQ